MEARSADHDVPASHSLLAEPCSPIMLPDGGLFFANTGIYTRDDVSRRMSGMPAKVFGVLAKRQGITCANDFILRSTGIRNVGSLKVTISGLRAALLVCAPDLEIGTVRGFGYMLCRRGS